VSAGGGLRGRKMNFKCYNCDTRFEAEDFKKEYIDPMYGPCSKMVAECPKCGGEASEYREPKPQKVESSSVAPCGMTPGQAGCSSCQM
jgi:hypothetical protein